MDYNFWETERYKDANLSKINFPDDINDKIISWIKNDKDMLVFLGTVGIGKSYLVAAYIHYLQSRKEHFRFFTEYDFNARMRETINKGWDYEYEIKSLCSTRYFILDDIGAGQLTEFQKETLQTLIDVRYNLRLPTIITSNLFLNDMKHKLSPRIASRLGSSDNILIELSAEDKRNTIG